MILRPMFRLKTKAPEDDTDRWLVVGLGNPGAQYARSWHNCGFRALEVLSTRHGIRMDRIKFKGVFGKGRIGTREAILLLPTTFMNLSGESVGEAMRFFRVPQERTIVLFDDVDIPMGVVKVRTGGGPGTHNGMKSVVSHIGNKDFPQFPCILAGERLKCEQFFLCHQDRHSLFQFHRSLSWEADTPL